MTGHVTYFRVFFSLQQDYKKRSRPCSKSRLRISNWSITLLDYMKHLSLMCQISQKDLVWLGVN